MECSSYLTVDTLLLHYKHQPVRRV